MDVAHDSDGRRDLILAYDCSLIVLDAMLPRGDEFTVLAFLCAVACQGRVRFAARVRDLLFHYLAENEGATVPARLAKGGMTTGDASRAGYGASKLFQRTRVGRSPPVSWWKHPESSTDFLPVAQNAATQR